MIFKVGDKVRIKNYDINSKLPKHVVSSMYNYFGKILTISDIDMDDSFDNDGDYTCQECPRWYWKKSDFKDINDFKLFDNKLFKI